MSTVKGILCKALSGSMLLFFLLSTGSYTRTIASSTFQGESPGNPGGPLMISAHRGASGHGPENTLLAYSSAMTLGVDFIEIDVRRTLDNKMVIMHDGSLKRTTGLDRLVNECTLKEIKKLSVNEGFGEDYPSEKAPTLREVCQMVRTWNKRHVRHVNLYVDCKDINVAEVMGTLKKYDLLDSSVFYGSIQVLSSIRELSPHALLVPAFPGTDQVEEVIKKLNPYAFDVSWNAITPDIIKLCKSKNILVFSDLLWDNDLPSEYTRARQMGIDLIQTDYIERVHETLQKHEK
ncbi:MAG: glycerophosphodiester phosphodiesterase family protein [Cyclobacteriaceae bacterium]|nr:glycerophosphodiester phosphodiesterase family protein [Cyclobacteriaceae bacterium]